MNTRQRRLVRAVAIALAAGSIAAPAIARADEDTQQEIRALKQQIEALSRKVDELSRRQEAKPRREERMEAAPPAAAPATLPGNSLTFHVGGGNITLYGHVDVSLDDQTNG